MENSLTQQYVWNFKNLFSGDTDEAIKVDAGNVKESYEKFAQKWKQRNDYLENPEVLKQALEEFEQLIATYDGLGKSGMYWLLRNVTDQSNEVVKAEKTKAIANAVKAESEITFFTLSLSKIEKEAQEVFLNAPVLSGYKHFLEHLFESATYLLSEKEEQLLLAMSQTGHDKWVDMVREMLGQAEQEVVVDETGKREKKNFDQLLKLATSDSNEAVRNSAADMVTSIQRKLAPIATHELNAILLTKKIEGDLRAAPRPDTERLLRDDMEPVVVDSLREVVTDNFGISHRYYALKAKLLNKNILKYHERMLPYGEDERKYEYSEAVQIVSSVLKRLDPDFVAYFDQFMQCSLIDVFPRLGKMDGGACYSSSASEVPYIYLNYSGKVRDIQTLAHEVGHGIHFMLSKNQTPINQGHSTATAEVASTYVEGFVTRELAKELTDEQRLSFLLKELDDHVGAVFRQVALYNFEMELHTKFKEKMSFSEEELGELFKKHMKAYMGDSVEVEQDASYWWVYWSHIRMFFYVYSYASGHLISQSMQYSTQKDPLFVTKVKEFLSSGTVKSPKDIFLDMGIDISQREFWENSMKAIENVLDEAEGLAKKLGKMASE